MIQDGPPPRHLHPVEPPFDPEHDDRGNGGGRRPPHDRAAEQAVLATLIYVPDAHQILTPELDTDDFYWPAHAKLWDAWHDLHQIDAVPPDTVTLNAELVRRHDTDSVRIVTDLANSDANPALALQHARIIRDAAKLRVVDALATSFGQLVRTATPDKVQFHLEEALQRLDETVTRFGATAAATTGTGLKDLSWLLGGTPPVTPPPVHARRVDGTALFYAGKVNGLIGDPESAKTWLAQIAGVEALNDGGTFVMIDVDHNGPDHTAARLVLLGARLEHLADPERFRYYEPEEGEELRAAITEIVDFAPTVLVVDSIGEVFPMLGVNTNDGDEITSALRLVCTKPANAGTCVITIDHLPKSTDARATGFAIGSIAKKRMIRGSYLRVEAKVKPVPGGRGIITLRIEKDTSGELRKSSGGGHAGTLTLDSTQPHVTTWSISTEAAPTNDDGTFRPTGLMEKVSKYIEDNDQCTFTDLADAMATKRQWVTSAVQLLVTEGFVVRFDGARRAKLHHSTAPYRQTEDDHVTTPVE